MRLATRLVGTLAVGALACSAPERPPVGTGGTGGAGAVAGIGGSAAGSASSGGAGAGGSGGNVSGSGGVAGTAGSGAEAGAPVSCEMTVPGSAPLRLLTHVQYDNTVAHLLGDTSAPSSGFPAENEVGGFSNNVASNQVNPRLVESMQTVAEALALRAVTERLGELAPCSDEAGSAACGHDFIIAFGERAFRRPLEEGEAAIFDELFVETLPRGYPKAIELVMRAMLQSPQFVYRVDAYRAPTETTGALALGPYELGARLALFLTNSTPDDTLLSAAATGKLASDADIEAQALRLLESPLARGMASDFMLQWLGVGRLEGAAREAADVPHGPIELVPDWKASLGAYLEDAVFNQGTVSALFTSPTIYVTPKLAPLYGVEAPASGVLAVNRPGERHGLLTQPALMALLAHADQSAPVLRGAFVRERVMCVEVEPPPPEVNPTPPDVDPNATTRERFRQHTEDPGCAGCHVLIDGIGWGFEQFDQFGRFRETEHGLAIDTTGQIVETGDPELDGPLTGAADLAARLASSSRVRDCVATQWYRYAMGRMEEPADLCSLTTAKERFRQSGGSFRELLLGIVLSDAFRYRPAMGETP
jgi:hypothetical protein